MNEKDKYAPTGETMRRIGNTVRYVETGGKLPDGGLKKRHRLIPHEEGILLDDLEGTDDPNVPTSARFQIKSPHKTGDGWSNETEPSIVKVLNRTPASFTAETPGFAKELRTDKWYFYTLGGGGGGDRIWFEISSVICNEDLTKTLNVTATHYTGGCDKEIPGEDEYGNIVIEDICGILNYYTQEWLESGGVKGSATYMYPRGGYCEPLWLVDNVCGQPECA